MIKQRKPLKRVAPPKRKTWLARSSKPIKSRGAAKERKEKRYKAFLSSPAWKRIRLAKLDWEGWRCANAEGTIGILYRNEPHEGKLHVHHKTYVRFGGKERMEDLEVLCERCHRLEHGTAYWRGRHR